MKILIIPQAALLGIALLQRQGNEMGAFLIAREALALQQRCFSQRYTLTILTFLKHVLEKEVSADTEFQKQVMMFCHVFDTLYGRYECPKKRFWQSVTVENTHEAGLVLRMLRKANRKTMENAVYDGQDTVVEVRQLNKIEKGTHKPSAENYRRLISQFEKPGEWKLPLLETTSIEALALRQRISTLVSMKEWKMMVQVIEKFKALVDASQPRVKQDLLFWKGILKNQDEDRPGEECLQIFEEALACTVPDSKKLAMEWWVYQREEAMIMSNIAGVYRDKGELKTAIDYCMMISHSLHLQMERTGIPCKGYGVMINYYAACLGDMGLLERGMVLDNKSIQTMLRCADIRGIQEMLYDLAWAAYELASEKPEKKDFLQKEWRENYLLSDSLAQFMEDRDMIEFLAERKEKYLR